jgi:hypothetical protein
VQPDFPATVWRRRRQGYEEEEEEEDAKGSSKMR